HIVRACLARGIAVRAMRRVSSSSTAIDGLEVEPVVGDLADQGTLLAAMKGCEVVFHAAGYYPANSRNRQGALRQAVVQIRNVLDAAVETGVARVLYASSIGTIGSPREAGQPVDEREFYVPSPGDHPYLEVKWAQEQEAFRFVARGLPVVILNPAFCVGPGNVKPTSGLALLAVARGWAKWYVDAPANLVDVRDVAEAHVAAVERGRVGERYILGGENLSLREALTLIAEEAGVSPPRWRVPLDTAVALARPIELLARHLVPGLSGAPTYVVDLLRHGWLLDSSKAVRELGLRQSPVRQAVREGLTWFREHGYL
ncbi:MAG: NAD-dependent epimerase/dehydratase family protein, partial [Candidatus Rokubacteria bacterium]|nr:NAD-dependent epimerase/dehydratase family protein [Candidatus Rokubacteria bacterium]